MTLTNLFQTMRNHHIPLYLAIVLFQFSCTHLPKELPDQDPGSVKYSESYKLPEFQDHERMEKIRQALTESDNLFEDCARQNQIPGIAYGILVDQTRFPLISMNTAILVMASLGTSSPGYLECLSKNLLRKRFLSH